MSSGNIFADVGLPNAEEVLLKSDLAVVIGVINPEAPAVAEFGCEIVGIDQPKVSVLMSGDTRGFSADRLIKILTRLGQDDDICVHNSTRAKGRVRVEA